MTSEKEYKELLKSIKEKGSWEHAHVIISYWEGKTSVYQQGFLELLSGESSGIVETLKNSTHPSNWKKVREYQNSLREEIATLTTLILNILETKGVEGLSEKDLSNLERLGILRKYEILQEVKKGFDNQTK